MRRNRFALITAAVLATLMAAPVASATPLEGPSTAAFASDNVEWVDILPQHVGTSGGKLVGKFYYLTDPRGLYIYDVSKPEAPALAGELLAPSIGAGAALAQEDPDTNGNILLLDASDGSGGNKLLIIDVKDKAAPAIVGSMAVTDHTWTCFLDCKYAIGRSGHILDLRDPSKPEEIADWKASVGMPGYMHDFEEVSPGLLIGAGQPSYYLDVRNPLKPKELSAFTPEFHSLGYHSAIWPRGGKDNLLLMGAEVAPTGSGNTNAGSDCAQDNVHALATFDARAAVKKGPKPGANFTKLSEWRVAGRGAYADGNAPAHTLYCGHWFDPHPTWKNGGLLAIGHYDWGTRFLDISSKGEMKEIGYFQPVAGHTSSAEWISKDIVYVHDYRRGLEILRFTGKV